MSDREAELERHLKYVTQKAERYMVTVDAADDAGYTLQEAGGRRALPDSHTLVAAVREARDTEIAARTILKYAVADACQFLYGESQAAA